MKNVMGFPSLDMSDSAVYSVQDKVFKTIFTLQLDTRNYYELNIMDLGKEFDCLQFCR